jgi:hypothetical protein
MSAPDRSKPLALLHRETVLNVNVKLSTFKKKKQMAEKLPLNAQEKTFIQY